MTTEPVSDMLHEPGSSQDLWFTETAWYSFRDTTGRYMGHVYFRFRPQSGLVDCNLYIWDEEVGTPHWEATYWKRLEARYPESLNGLSLGACLRHDVVADFRSYRISYSDDSESSVKVQFELAFEAVGEPRWFGRKHFDQPMEVRGALAIGERQLAVNCRMMRDRSWYSRSDFGAFHSGYSYFLSEQDELLVLSAYENRDQILETRLKVIGGYCRIADRDLRVVGGWRIVRSRDQRTGAPDAVDLEISLEDGTDRLVSGSCQGSLGIAANPGMLSWMSNVRWRHGDELLTGEDQEIWSPGCGVNTVSSDACGSQDRLTETPGRSRTPWQDPPDDRRPDA